MPKPTFKDNLRRAVPQYGMRTQFCSPIVAELLGFCGYDYVYIDMEHSPNDLMSVLHQCHALAGTGAQPVVRLPANDPAVIQGLLDIGVENLVVPMVETVEQARQAAAITRYPPRGTRSMARAHRGNQYGVMTDYVSVADDRICLIVQIESAAAIGRIGEIAAVDGVDGLLFGPADLAADMGHAGNGDHPDVLAAIAGALAPIIAAGKFPGMSTGNAATAGDWIRKGVRFISVAGDVPALAGQAKRALADARAAPSDVAAKI